jgi:hypothetical protein
LSPSTRGNFGLKRLLIVVVGSPLLGGFAWGVMNPPAGWDNVAGRLIHGALAAPMSLFVLFSRPDKLQSWLYIAVAFVLLLVLAIRWPRTDYKAKNPLPRPGAREPIEFAETTELDRHGEFAYEFVESMVGVRPFFMSDGSSLADFAGVAPMAEVHANILDRYGIDSTAFETEPLWKLLDAVVAARNRR